jgi:hypothetical protein
MKKIYFFSAFILVLVLLSSSYSFKDQNGRANATGSPGEATCGACHSGGSSASASVSLSATPSFSNDLYYPDSVYSITVTVSASAYNKFGFGCEVLTDLTTNSGFLSNPGPGAKIIATSRRNVTHSTPKTGVNNAAEFTFRWTAPSAGAGTANFYICGNAVNGNNTTSGDLPIPFQYSVTEASLPADSTDITGIRQLRTLPLSALHVSPNPSNGLVQIDYVLHDNAKVAIVVTSLAGQVIKSIAQEQQFSGANSYILNANDLPKGIYFVRLTTNGRQAASRLLTLY